MRRLLVAVTLLIALSASAWPLTTRAGDIAPALSDQLAAAPADARVRALVVLRDQVDIARLDRELRSAGASLAGAVGFLRFPSSSRILFSIGIGTNLVPAFAGATDANGDASVTIGVPKVVIGLTVYTQALIDDRSGPTAQILPGNVVGVTLTP